MQNQTVIYGFGKGDRSGKVMWLLEEMGKPYDFQVMSFQSRDHEKPEYLAMNPMGMSPTYRQGDQVIFESGAICTYLADAHPEAKLAPAPTSPERAEYLQWIFFLAATVDPKFNEIFLARATGDDSRKEQATKDLLEMFEHVEKHLSRRDYILKSGFSAADVYWGVAVNWLENEDLARFPACRRYLERLRARPAAKKCDVLAE